MFVISTIVRLFLGSCPSTVLRGIGAVYINAVNTVLWAWSWSHVIKKVFEGVKPTILEVPRVNGWLVPADTLTEPIRVPPSVCFG